MNDLINIYESDPSGLKKCLILIVDDGADYGIRSSITMYYFGQLFFHLNLDLLIVVKNAPKDSRFNPIEHLWGFLSNKMSGMVLPVTLEDGDDDFNLQEDSPEALDQTIDILNNTFMNKEFNGFAVNPVAVHCNNDSVVINDHSVPYKTFDEIESIKNVYDSSLCQKRIASRDPKLMKEVKLISKHMDKRSHSIIYRKCMKELGDKPCHYCSKNPATVSQSLMEDRIY